MDIKAIISEIEAEIVQLARVKEALQGATANGNADHPRLIVAIKTVAPKKRKRRITPEGRARIAAAQKARWAKVERKKE